MYIDTHTHFTSMPIALKDWRDRQIREYDESGRHLEDDLPVITDDMLREGLLQGPLEIQRQHGIDLALLSPIAGRMAHHHGDQEISRTWSRISNDLVHRATRLFPDRLVGMCQLPQSLDGDIEACVEELRRCVLDLGFVGCVINPDPSDGRWDAPSLADAYYEPLFEEMARLGVPGLVHTSMSANPAVDSTCAHYLNGDITAFMQIIGSDLFERFPELRLIIPHGGGAVPFHWERYQGARYDQGKGDLTDFMRGHLYFDTCVYGQRGMQLLVDTVPAENLLFASEMIGAVRGVDPRTGRRYDDTRSLLDATVGLDDAERDAIASQNALRVFPRLRNAISPEPTPADLQTTTKGTQQ